MSTTVEGQFIELREKSVCIGINGTATWIPRVVITESDPELDECSENEEVTLLVATRFARENGLD